MCFRSVPFSKLSLQIPGLFKMSKYEEHWGGQIFCFFFGGVIISNSMDFTFLPWFLPWVFSCFFPGKPPSKSACSKRALAEKRCFTTSKRPEAALMRKGEMPKRSSSAGRVSRISGGGGFGFGHWRVVRKKNIQNERNTEDLGKCWPCSFPWTPKP